MPFSRSTLTATVLASALFLGACGDDETVTDGGDDSGEGSTTIVDREFWSTDVVVDGEPFDLVPGTRISLRFGADSVSAGAGCNNIGGDYTLDGDTLVVGDMFTTEMGCDPERHAQDDLVIRFLSAGPTVALDGDTLTLTAGDDTITLLDTDVADPDVPLDGGAWEVTGFFDELAAWAHAVDVADTVTISGSTITVVDACGTSTLAATFADDTTATVEPPEQWPVCDGETPAATQDLRRALEAGRLVFEVDGRNLRISTGADLGVTLTAAG